MTITTLTKTGIKMPTMSSTVTHLILDQTRINHIIRRMAYQVYETNVNEKEVIIAGVKENGVIFANKLKQAIELIAPLKITLCEIHIHKKNPLQPITLPPTDIDFNQKSIVVADDVLHSGSTLIHSVKYFLNHNVKQIKTAVLIDRNHKRFPVKADFKGISLSTSINENVSVIFEKNKDRAVIE